MSSIVRRPEGNECADYYWRYIDLVPDCDVLGLLCEGTDKTAGWLGAIPSDKHGFRYAEGKWSVREVIGHVIDTERAFAFRAFCFARRDPNPLPSLEQDPYVANARYDRREMHDIAREYATVRAATLALFDSLEGDDWDCRGVASGREFTVRTLPFIVAGHEIHHWEVLRERYRVSS